MKLYIFDNNSNHGALDRIIIAADSEKDAREIIDDYDSPYVYSSEQYNLIAVKNFNRGVIDHNYE